MLRQKWHEIEEELFIEAIYQRYGYDFRNYSRHSFSKRLQEQKEQENIRYLSELIPKVIYDKTYFHKILNNLTINVTEMFRNPVYYQYFTQHVLNQFAHANYFKIWHAGCSTGEEVYSTAIILQEYGMLERAQIYATDINLQALERAKMGIYSLVDLNAYEDNYSQANGKYRLSKYYFAKYGSGKMHSELTENALFTEHNLACDNVFGEIDIIICRNVLIYFNQYLKERVIELFLKSLSHKGFLCLGDKESLDSFRTGNHFKLLDRKAKIYQKIN